MLVLVAGGPPREELIQAPPLPRGDGGIQPLRVAPHLDVDQVAVTLLVVATIAAVDDRLPEIDPAFPPPRLVDIDRIPILALRRGGRRR